MNSEYEPSYKLLHIKTVISPTYRNVLRLSELHHCGLIGVVEES